MLAEAKKLEDEFERVATDAVMPCLEKRLELSRLIRRMFDEAVKDYIYDHHHRDYRSDFVIDFFERFDLGPALIEKAFECEGEGENNLNYLQLMKLAEKKSAELKPYTPEVSYAYKP